MAARRDGRDVVRTGSRPAKDLADEQRLINASIEDPDVVRRALTVLEDELERPPGRNFQHLAIESDAVGDDDGTVRRRGCRRTGRAGRWAAAGEDRAGEE